ncbi:general secretion pathway protein GspB [Dasania marina]|uniref:general secretion pathway protein GspB n=1 Tax=Dasania marina TaxID=471499 RepID=UPI00035C3777|nr:general secretion pathway protein GspB [Dasania marina]
MSLILEALNRADRDRSAADHSPSLQAAPINIELASSGPNIGLFAVIGLAIVLLGGGYFYTNANSPSNNNSYAEQAATTIAPITVPSIVAPVIKAPAITAPIATTTITTTKKNTAKEIIIEAKPPIKNDNPDVAKLYQQHSSSKPVDASDNTASLKTKLATSKQSTLPPFLSSLPVTVQKHIPTLNYDQHIFLESGESFVEINDKIFKEGAAITSELSLESIQERFIILRYQQTHFRLSALNSWVNFQ